MSNKVVIYFIFIMFSIHNKALSQENIENSVPPIQYPEKSAEEMQVRKEIKNSFIKSEESSVGLNNLNPQKSSSDSMQEKNLKSETAEKSRAFDDLIGQNITSSKNETAKKGINVTLKDAEDRPRQSEAWKVFLISAVFIAILGFLGYLLTKFKKKGFLFSQNKNEKMMDIISTLPISPKRQVMVLRIRDQEIVVSNTEAGIHFLTEISANYANKNSHDKKQVQISDKFLLPKNSDKRDENSLQQLESNSAQLDRENDKKSDILLRALKSINSNSVNQKKNTTQENSNSSSKTEAFPKYLANRFENEGKKEVKKREEEVDSVENVTNLIREKLRSMKPLN